MPLFLFRLVLIIFLMGSFSPALITAQELQKDAEQLDFAHGLFGRNMYTMAIEEYQKLIKTFPESPLISKAHFGMAESYFFQNQYEPAATEYEIFIQSSPDDVNASIAKVRLGQIYFQSKQYDKALEILVRLKVADLNEEGQYLAYFYVAKCYREKGEFPLALEFFLRSIQVTKATKDIALSNLELADVSIKQSDYPKANAFYQAAYKIAEDPATKAVALYKQGEMFLLASDYQNAIKIFEKFLTEYKNQTIAQDAVSALLLSFFKLQKHDEVLLAYEKYLTILIADKKRYDTLYIVSSSYLQKENYSQALFTIDQALAISSLSQEDKQSSLLKKSEILFKSQQLDAALKFIADNKLEENSKDKQNIILLQAEAYYELGNFQKAFELYETILKDYPNTDVSDTALYAISYCQNALKNTTKAIELFHRYFQEGKDVVQRQEALYNAILLAKESDTQQALHFAREFLATFNDSKEREKILFVMATLYSDSQQFQPAIETLLLFMQEFKESERTQDAYFLMGYNLQLAQRPDEALAYYQKISKEENSQLYYSALKNIAVIYLSQGEDEKATLIFNEMVKDFSTNDLDVDTYLWLAEKNIEKENYQEVLSMLKDAKAEEGDAHSQHAIDYFRAVAYQKIKQFDAAIDKYSKVIESNLETTYVGASYIGKAYCYAQQEKYDEAKAALEKVIITYTDDISLTMRARFELAQILEKSDQLEEAAKYYMLVAVLYNEEKYCSQALFRAGQIFEKLNRELEALKVYAEIAELYPQSEWFALSQERIKSLNEN